MNNPEIKIKEKCGVRGHVILREHAAGSVQRWQEMIKQGKGKEALAEMRSGKIVAENDNTIMQASSLGFDQIVQWLGSWYTGSSADLGGINYGAIGTGSTTPTTSDTQLTSESARVPVQYFQDSGFNEAIFQFFFADGTISNTTYYEFGSFMKATSTANSGLIFNHALFSSGYTKTSGTDITAELTVSFSA